MFKRIIKKNIGWILLAAAAAAALIIVNVSKEWILQNYGTNTFKVYDRALSYIAGAAAGWLIICLIVSSVRIAGEEKDKDRAEKRIEELKKQQEQDERSAKAKLNVKGPLKDAVIYERMKAWLNESWGGMTTTDIPALMSDILRQMDDMNAYQSKLSRLLTNNGADYLDDTNGVLESVEQNILRKVRKVLNCFVVYETDNVSDVQKMRTLLAQTRDSNESQLNSVKDFLFAITDFLNKQGDDNTGAEKLDIYKRTILESITDKE